MANRKVNRLEFANPEEQAQLRAEAVKLADRFEVEYNKTRTVNKGAVANDLAKLCYLGDPTIELGDYASKLKLMTLRQLLALRLLSNRDEVDMLDWDLARELGVLPKYVLQWSQDVVFAFLLKKLALGYNLSALKPLVVEVLVETLDRRYVADIHDKDTGEKLHYRGERILDGTTVSAIKEAKGFFGVATEVNEQKALSPEETKEQDKSALSFAKQNPELVAMLRRKVLDAEKSMPQEVGAGAAVTENGELKGGE
jgi:hypothetical protein